MTGLASMLKKWLRRWYQGRDVRVDPDEPDEIGGMRVLHATRKEYHWTATAVRSLVAFYIRNWVTLWTLGAAYVGLYVAYLSAKCG